MTEVNGEVAVGVVENDGKYLLARRSESNSSSGKWTFPGGKIKENEDLEEAIEREISEETGLNAKVIRKGKAYINKGELGYWKVHPFLLKSESRNVDLNHELDQHEWIDISDLDEFDTLGKMKAPEKLDIC